MNRKYLIRLLLVLIVVFGASNVFAAGGKGAIKGEVTAVGADTLTIQKSDGTVVSLIFADGFESGDYAVGDQVMVKGTIQDDGTFLADFVKLLGGPNASNGKGNGNANKGQGNNNGNNNKTEDGGLANNPFCNGEKESAHPIAVGLSEKFGISAEEVIGYFCDGNSFGAIMLAIKTAELSGGDVASILAARGEEGGWGQIWKELGLVGNTDDAESPPGHLKRPEWAGPPEGKGPNSDNPDD